MDDFIYSGVLVLSAFVAGWIAYFIVRVLLKQWCRVISSKGFTVNTAPLNGPLCNLFPLLFLATVIPSLRIPAKSHLFVKHFGDILLIAIFGLAYRENRRRYPRPPS
jgi:hypothetical protein